MALHATLWGVQFRRSFIVNDTIGCAGRIGCALYVQHHRKREQGVSIWSYRAERIGRQPAAALGDELLIALEYSATESWISPNTPVLKSIDPHGTSRRDHRLRIGVAREEIGIMRREEAAWR